MSSQGEGAVISDIPELLSMSHLFVDVDHWLATICQNTTTTPASDEAPGSFASAVAGGVVATTGITTPRSRNCRNECTDGSSGISSETTLLKSTKEMIGLPEFLQERQSGGGADDTTTITTSIVSCPLSPTTNEEGEEGAVPASSAHPPEYFTSTNTMNPAFEEKNLERSIVRPDEPPIVVEECCYPLEHHMNPTWTPQDRAELTRFLDEISIDTEMTERLDPPPEEEEEESGGDNNDAAEASVVQMVHHKRKRGKDLSCLLHRRALELDDREATIEQREMSIEIKAQGLVEEIQRQDSMIRKRQRTLLMVEQKNLAYQINVKEMLKRLWRKRQESTTTTTLRGEEDDNDCFICYATPIDCILVPCGHMVACLGCANKLKRTCCICNQKAKPQKIFRTLA